MAGHLKQVKLLRGPLAGCKWLVLLEAHLALEDVPQVATTVHASDLCPHGAKGPILLPVNCAWPAAATVELGLRPAPLLGERCLVGSFICNKSAGHKCSRVEDFATACTLVLSLVLVLIVLSCARALCALAPQYAVLHHQAGVSL